jgi:NAD(P)-dependent dehydrogenase (short-subunit alcohol dehydrogenase family)
LRHDTYPAIDPTKADLSGKYIFITGASKGVGKAAAMSFARAGAAGLALGARSSLISVVEAVKLAAKEAGHPEPKILPLYLDVTDRASVEAAASQTLAAFRGRVDVLINNAGYLSNHMPLVDTDPEEWWYEYAVNMKGPYLVTRAFLPLLLASPHKVLLNISSIAAHMPGVCSSSYATSKLALLRFTEIVDIEHGVATEDGIVAVSVHPASVKTELALHLPRVYHELLVDTPELAGDSLVWLARERREWLAGRYVSSNWDMGELEERREEILRGDLLKVRMAVNLFPSV